MTNRRDVTNTGDMIDLRDMTNMNLREITEMKDMKDTTDTAPALDLRDREKIRGCVRYLMRHKFIINSEELHELFLTATNPAYEDTIRDIFDYAGFDYVISTDAGREAVMICDAMDEDRLVPKLSKTYSTILLILAREYRTRIQNLSTMKT